MKQLVSVGIRARFALTAINAMWAEYNRQAEGRPELGGFYQVGEHHDIRADHAQSVLVRIHTDAGGKVATMLLAGEL